MTVNPLDRWAETCLAVLGTPYPYGAAHMSRGDSDNDVTPWVLHPAFHGCLDWHSSAHMQYSLVAMASTGRLAPSLADRVAAELGSRLTPENLATEAEYLRANTYYERPYGWAWALQLHAACARSPLPQAAAWAEALEPLTEVVAANVIGWLAKQVYPVRHGVHTNSAFALALLGPAAETLGRADLASAIRDTAAAWFGADERYDTRFEPGGTDFLSGALAEVQCMMWVLGTGPGDGFGEWFEQFLPRFGAERQPALFALPEVRDRTDGHMVHLVGLALHRAWVLRDIAAIADDKTAAALRGAAAQQFEWAAEEVNTGHFMSTHWLVTYALLASGEAQL
ncbi:DUF2891 family protein [Micrococcales bacterium 31B]|nr:DUF2891 family protein [Micrococcales bacterium 31B]